MLAIATVIAVVVLSILVSRIATVALTVTGLSRESARFQARSALSGTGFTTDEAEQVVNHPVRRRIVMALMLLGTAGLVTVIASLLVGFVGPIERADAALRLLVLIGGLLAVLLLARNERVDRWLSRVIARLLGRWTDLDTRDYARLLHLSGPYAVTEVSVRDDDWVSGHTLRELRLTDEGVVVLGIQRADGSYIGTPQADTPVQGGDTLIVYGRSSDVSELSGRPTGPAGDDAHQDAVAEQRLVLNAEQSRDPARTPDGDPSGDRRR